MDSGDKFIGILLLALVGVCIILASTGVWNGPECIHYWDGNVYTCTP
jgi:hypothetical protein